MNQKELIAQIEGLGAAFAERVAPLAEVAPERCPPNWDELLPPSGVYPRGPLE